jgi:hypothetical protein
MATETRRRIFYSLTFELELEPEPGSLPGSSATITFPLNRAGISTASNGKPRPPKQRTIDLRVGDFVMVNKVVQNPRHQCFPGRLAHRRAGGKTVQATWYGEFPTVCCWSLLHSAK